MAKKRKKSSRMHGRKMGTSGHGARKKAKKTGHKGGKGMSGSGKRADHKKTLITKLYGGKYFGKQGITSKRTKRDKSPRINLQIIEKNLDSYGKKTNKGFEIDLRNSKILGTGEVKNKLIIKAKKASKSAIEKVEKAGGKLFLSPKFDKNGKQTQSIEKVEKAGGKLFLSPKFDKNGKQTQSIEKVEKAGGDIILFPKKEAEK